MKPDARHYNPSPEYLRQLIDRVRDPELMHEGKPSQQKIAARLGIPPRTFRQYLTNQESHKDAPYAVQFSLEALAGWKLAGTMIVPLSPEQVRQALTECGEVTIECTFERPGKQ